MRRAGRAGSTPPTSTRPAVPGPAALQRPQQRRLARAVAPHQRGDARRRAGRRSTPRTATVGAVAHDHRRAASERRPGRRGCGVGRRAGAGQPGAQRRGAAGGRRGPTAAAGPAGEPAQLDHGRARRARSASTSAGCARRRTRAVAGQQDDPVGELHHPLQPVLGHQTVTPRSWTSRVRAAQHLLGRGRVQRGGGLVEHQHPRVHGQHRADGDPLLLAAGQGAQRRGARRSAMPSRSRVSSTRRRMVVGRRGRAAPCRRPAPPRRCR